MADDTTAPAGAPDAPAEDIYQLFETDPQAESKGVWFPVGPSRFRIRAAGSPEVTAVRDRQNKRQQRQLLANNGSLPPHMIDANDIELCAAMIADWENVPDPDDRTRMLPCTDENKRKVLGRPGMRNFRNRIWALALNEESYRKAALEEVEGNSSTASGGRSGAAPSPGR